MYQLSALTDFFSALALLAALAWSYGFLFRTLRSAAYAQFFLGAMFGGVALLQMFSPLDVAPGIIVDMRNVPVLLAGAYLGWRGALPCLLIAVAARVYVGGTGMSGGVLGLLIATIVALGWHEVMHSRPKRGVLSLVILGALGISRLVGLFLIPPDVAIYMLQNVFPIVISLEIVALVVIGLLLEREVASMRNDATLRASAVLDPGSGLLSPDGLERAYSDQACDLPTSVDAGLVLLQIRHHEWIVRKFGVDALDDARAVLRRRIEKDLPRGDLLGLTRRGEVALVMFHRSPRALMAYLEDLRCTFSAERIRLRDGAELRITVDFSQSWGPVSRPLCQQIQEARINHGQSPQELTKLQTSPVGVIDGLFGRVERLLR